MVLNGLNSASVRHRHAATRAGQRDGGDEGTVRPNSSLQSALTTTNMPSSRPSLAARLVVALIVVAAAAGVANALAMPPLPTSYSAVISANFHNSQVTRVFWSDKTKGGPTIFDIALQPHCGEDFEFSIILNRVSAILLNRVSRNMRGTALSQPAYSAHA
jgi:hypothetical protein